MAKIKLTKTVVDAATFGTRDYELRDTVVSGFLLKVTPAGRKIFMLQYRTNAGNRRKPAIGRFGELTVEQARSIAQDWRDGWRSSRVLVGGGGGAPSRRRRSWPRVSAAVNR